MNDERIKFTNKEKFAQSLGGTNDFSIFNLAKDDDIEDLIANEKANKFNNEVDEHAVELEKQRKAIEQYQEDIQKDFSKIEIKPLFGRIMVKPFAYNPFQRMKVENGIITDLGGMNPKINRDMQTGQLVEQDQMITVATVIEVGPDCKYVKPGDTVFYMKNIPTPVPFFKQGFWTLKEENLIAVVNEGLEARFNEIKNGK